MAADQAEAEFPEETVPAASGDPARFGEPDGRWRRDFDGLLYLGALTSEFEYLHHTICIRTLTTDELLIVAQLTAEWDATIGGTRAYATAMCAMAMTSADGQPMPSPLGDGGDSIEWARQRFRWARRLYPYTIDAVYNRYVELEARVQEVLAGLGKASGRADATPGSNGPSASPPEGASWPGTGSP